jgi:hypothetical protein
MSLYKYELTNTDLKILHKWAKSNEWSDIKKQIYIMIKNNYNNKYIKEHDHTNTDIYPILVKLSYKMEASKLIDLIKTLNADQIGGYYPYVSNQPLQGGINYGKVAGLVKSKASVIGKKAQSQIKAQGKKMADQAQQYAQDQAQQAKQYVQQQAQQAQQKAAQYIQQQAEQAQQYAQQQAQQAQQYAQQQAQQMEQKFENKVVQAGQHLQNYLSPYTQILPQGYIATPVAPGYNTPTVTSGYNTPTVATGYMPQVLSDTSAQSLETPIPQSTGLVDSVLDFAGNIGEKVMGF